MAEAVVSTFTISNQSCKNSTNALLAHFKSLLCYLDPSLELELYVFLTDFLIEERF